MWCYWALLLFLQRGDEQWETGSLCLTGDVNFLEEECLYRDKVKQEFFQIGL